MKLFHICTIANKLSMYEEMKSSFIEAGFDEDRCRYSLLDNSTDNIYEPFSAFNSIVSNTVEPYIIFCHQDVLLNQGHGFNQLVSLIEELDNLDPNWAVLGNAGVNNHYQNVAKITDPNPTPNWQGDFPQKVHSLDDNFFVLKTSASLTFSSEIKGFLFYAADLCLNAIVREYSCYVVNFHLTHLSGGKANGGKMNKNFYNVLSQFEKRWSREFNFCYIKIIYSPAILLSKHTWLRSILAQNRIINKIVGWWFFCNTPLRTLVNTQLQ